MTENTWFEYQQGRFPGGASNEHWNVVVKSLENKNLEDKKKVEKNVIEIYSTEIINVVDVWNCSHDN